LKKKRRSPLIGDLVSNVWWHMSFARKGSTPSADEEEEKNLTDA